jgi:hypothetical protein
MPSMATTNDSPMLSILHWRWVTYPARRCGWIQKLWGIFSNSSIDSFPFPTSSISSNPLVHSMKSSMDGMVSFVSDRVMELAANGLTRGPMAACLRGENCFVPKIPFTRLLSSSMVQLCSSLTVLSGPGMMMMVSRGLSVTCFLNSSTLPMYLGGTSSNLSKVPYSGLADSDWKYWYQFFCGSVGGMLLSRCRNSHSMLLF